jgi:CHASE2 domain-containing sensor protein
LPQTGATKLIWERELEQVPVEGTETAAVRSRSVLGAREDFDPTLYSTGLSLLIDSPEDQVTRRYRRYIETRDGLLPSFPTAVSMAYHSIQRPASYEDRVIAYEGSRDGSHRLHLNARSVLQLSSGWPASSPVKDKIVLLGGSYLGQDRHETPLGQMTGLEILANAVETDLNAGGERPPSRVVSFLLEIFEAFVLIVLFHTLRFPLALGSSVILIPVVALMCSLLAYGNISHFLEFSVVLLGLLLFELYEHFRRKAIPEVFEDLAGAGPS